MRIFVNSYPKSGTNLIEKLVRLLGYKQGKQTIALSSVIGRYGLIKQLLRGHSVNSYTVPIGLEVPVGANASWLKKYIESVPEDMYFTGHAAWNDYLDYLLSENDIKVLHMMRDPRAIISSTARYVVEDINKWYPFHKVFKKMDRKSLIKLIIQGGYVEEIGMYYSGISDALNRTEGWLDSKNAIVLKFEDMVGSNGGGNDAIQEKELRRIMEFLEVKDVDIKIIQEQLYGGTHTFRGGKIDGWKEDFDDELQKMIFDELKDSTLMRRLGYSDFLTE